MAKYSIIADIGKGLVNMLRDKLVPEPIDKPELIGICEPKERGGYIVGIHPYDIKENRNGQGQEKSTLPDGSIQDAPAMVEVYYMISVSSKAEMETKSTDEARIIGKIIQVLNDNPKIPERYMPQSRDYPRELVPVSALPLEMEEKVKVWTMFGESYKLSVFYVAGPVAIDSENIRKPTKRVETVLLNTTQFIPRKIVQFETRIKEEEIDDEYTQMEQEAAGGGDEDGDDGGDDFGGDDDFGNDDFGGGDDDDMGDEEFGEDDGTGDADMGDEEFGEDDGTGDADMGDEEFGEDDGAEDADVDESAEFADEDDGGKDFGDDLG